MSRKPVSCKPASHPTLRRLLPLVVLAGGAAVALSGCVAYPYDGYDGAPAYGYAGPVVAPSVVVAPTYRPYGYYGWRGGYGGWRGRRW